MVPRLREFFLNFGRMRSPRPHVQAKESQAGDLQRGAAVFPPTHPISSIELPHNETTKQRFSYN